jgi:hypothetical protein
MGAVGSFRNCLGLPDGGDSQPSTPIWPTSWLLQRPWEMEKYRKKGRGRRLGGCCPAVEFWVFNFTASGVSSSLLLIVNDNSRPPSTLPCHFTIRVHASALPRLLHTYSRRSFFLLTRLPEYPDRHFFLVQIQFPPALVRSPRAINHIACLLHGPPPDQVPLLSEQSLSNHVPTS